MYKILLAKMFNIKYVVQFMEKRTYTPVAFFCSKNLALQFARLHSINKVTRVVEVISGAVLPS